MDKETERFVALKEFELSVKGFAEAQKALIDTVNKSIDGALKAGAKLIDNANKLITILQNERDNPDKGTGGI